MPHSKRLIVTGARGFVAGSSLTQAGPEWELYAVSRGGPVLERLGLLWRQIDSLDPEPWTKLFDAVQPHAVIHTAAMADIDACEARPELASAVNVGWTRMLAHLCATHRARLVFCSTDTVFDGEHAPYREDSAPQAVNHYGRTKVEAELIVAALGLSGVVVRTSLVVGPPALGVGNSFLPRLTAALQAGHEVAVPASEVRTPIDVRTLGQALLELAGNDYHGVLHVAGNDRLDRLDLTRRIARRLGLPARLVVASDPTRATARAPRPRDVSLDNARARATLATPMHGFDDALALVFPASTRRVCEGENPVKP